MLAAVPAKRRAVRGEAVQVGAVATDSATGTSATRNGVRWTPSATGHCESDEQADARDNPRLPSRKVFDVGQQLLWLDLVKIVLDSLATVGSLIREPACWLLPSVRACSATCRIVSEADPI